MNKTSGGQASVPMNLFATWDIDKSSSNCIPRICTITVCKLIVLKELDKDLPSVFIAVKMQGSKRVFRSNEIFLQSNGLANTKLELTFSLQYPHFVKRDENRLQIMLQRKKRYKNRAMLGYKTLAVGRVDMAQIIQCPIVSESALDVFTAGKDQELILAAHILISSMNSLPIDADVESDRAGKHSGADRSPDVDNYSDDDEETFSSDQDMGSDNNQEYVDTDGRAQKHKNRRKVRMSSSSRQQNFIKTKVAALLRKFKQVADEGLEPDMEQDPDSHPQVPIDYDFLYDELEDFNLSDSCPDIEDNISIVSTPKPTLRPFFDRISHSSSQTEICSLREQTSADQNIFTRDVRNLNNSQTFIDDEISSLHVSKRLSGSYDSVETGNQTANAEVCGQANMTSQYSLSPRQNKATSKTISAPSSPEVKRAKSHDTSKKPHSRSASFREAPSSETHKEKLSGNHNEPVSGESLFTVDLEDGLPESVLLIDGNDRYGRYFANAVKLSFLGLPPSVVTHSLQDVQTTFTVFLTRLQKYLNSNSQSPTPVKVAVIGSDAFLNCVLRQFVEHLSTRSPDWQSYLIFFVVPLGSHKLSRHLSSIDVRYSTLFGESSWKESVEKLLDLPASQAMSNDQKQVVLTVASKLKEYISEASYVTPLTIAEAMLTFRQTSGDEDCSQKFLPFICDVKVGEKELLAAVDSDKEECISASANPSNQLPVSAAAVTSPPLSPSVAVAPPVSTAAPPGNPAGLNQPSDVKLGLQVDYWKERDASKYTLKTNFKSFQVSRIPTNGDRQFSPGLALDVVTKGKKNLMRLPGKKGKEKDSDSKSQAVSNITRLICASKHQHCLLQVKIDGVEWRDVKFFQLSSHWSSHVKALPVAVFVPV
ncbi:unnamed protein product [Clavelina lepadiformis]|uniref:Phosphofurin acidic cluster sorting protein 2 n=1 Tax=Clavelina lepadiformis TaxID=159417 RepID=A0ABP0GQJ5_CLALP